MLLEHLGIFYFANFASLVWKKAQWSLTPGALLLGPCCSHSGLGGGSADKCSLAPQSDAKPTNTSTQTRSGGLNKAK